MHMPPKNDGDFTPAPSGTHTAICYRLIDLGTQRVEWQGQVKMQHKILIGWELPDEQTDDGKPFTIHQRYTYSSSEKARLRNDLEAWRGKAFQDSDFGPGGFDIRNILGKGCLLSIVHAEKDGKTYANLKSISALPKSMTVGQPANAIEYLPLEAKLFDEEVFHSLSEGLQNVIKQSPEYQELVRNGPDESSVNGNYAALDDEIPF